MSKLTAEQLWEKVQAIQLAESYSRGFCFEVPPKTVFNNSYSGVSDPNNLWVLKSAAKVRLTDISAKGIGAYDYVLAYKADAEQTPETINYPSYKYIRLSWDEIVKDEKVYQNLAAWVDKITPNYTVAKDKGVITFTNAETAEKLNCDLTNQKFVRSYKKGKDRQIRYPAQFFKYVSGRLLIAGVKQADGCENFSKLVDLVAKNYRQCRNFGTFLVRMFDHQHLEQYIAANVPFDFNIPFAYSDFSKDIRKKLNENGIRYDQNIGSLFCSEIDTGRAVFAQIRDKAGFVNMIRILSYNIQPLNTLVNHYHYDLKTLFAYCRERNWRSHRNDAYRWYETPAQKAERERIEKLNPEDTTETLSDRYAFDIISYLRDYARMALDVYGAEYEKYPANLKEAHDQVTVMHRARAFQVNAQAFEATIDKTLEWKKGDFEIIYPKSAEEVIAEGQKLRHCVGSYIQSVVRGECKIVFLRQKENLDSPFVTIEISGDNIRQARGFGNSTPNYDARMALQDYAKDKKLLYRG